MATALACLTLAVLASAAPAHAASHRRARVGTHYAQVERVCPPAKPGHVTCLAERRVPATASTRDAQPYAVRHSFEVGPAGGYTPTDLMSAYKLGTFASLTAANAPGTGQTVGIVDAYDDPNIEDDLATFSTQYGLPACTTANGCFEKIGQTGSSSVLPPAAGTVPNSSGWDQETSLDVEAVHALCPRCKILLVEANTSGSANIGPAVDQAVASGATEVSNSYGGAEIPNTGPYEAAFSKPGVPMVASAGDDNYFNWSSGLTHRANLPAAYPEIIAAGGTSLELNRDGTRDTERVWNDETGPNHDLGGSGGTGGGCSAYYTAQSWQQSVAGWSNTGCGTKRLDNDVAALGDPLTGFDVLDTYTPNSTPAPGWSTVGGTSLSAPVLTAMLALAGGAQGVDYASKTLYAGFASHPGVFNDVTDGGNGYCDGATPCTTESQPYEDCNDTTACNARVGYDGPSGIGTPNGLTGLAPVIADFTLPESGTHDTTVSVDASASSSSVDAITSYHWHWGDGTVDSTTTGPTTTHTFTAAGEYDVSLTAITGDGKTSVPSTETIAIDTPLVPKNTAPAEIGGSTQEGQTFAVTAHGLWTRNPTSYAYKWQRCDATGAGCSDISGAGNNTYKLTGADVNHTVRVVETASNGAGAGTPKPSAASAVVQAGPHAPANTAAPTLVGVAKQNSTLTEYRGSWTDSPTQYNRTWLRCDSSGVSCSSIPNVTGEQYTLTAADVGYRIKVAETATNTVGTGDPAYTPVTDAVAAYLTPGSGSLGTGSGMTTITNPMTPSLVTPSSGGQAATVSAAQLKALAGKLGSPTGKGASIPMVLKSGGYTFAFTAPGATTSSVAWYFVPTGAHVTAATKKSTAKPIRVATGRASRSSAGKGTLKVRLTGKGKKLLKHAKHRLSLTAKVQVTSGGRKATTLKKFSVKR